MANNGRVQEITSPKLQELQQQHENLNHQLMQIESQLYRLEKQRAQIESAMQVIAQQGQAEVERLQSSEAAQNTKQMTMDDYPEEAEPTEH